MSTPTTQTSDAPAASAAGNAVVATSATTATSSASSASVVTSTVTTSSSPKRTISVGEYQKTRSKAVYARESLFDGIHDVDMEEGEEEKESSSSGRDEASVGTRRPREDDSDASSSKRSRSGSDRPLADAGSLFTPRDGDDDDSTPSAAVTSRTNPPGKNNILADALSRRPDYDPRTVLGRQGIDDEDEDDDHCAVCIASGINLTNVAPEMDLRDEIVAAYADDAGYAGIVAYLRAPTRIIHEFHDSPMGAHLGREKTFAAVSRDFFWPHMYKWVRKWVRTCETCQRVKPSKLSQAPLRPLPIATEGWRSVSMDFIFGLPPDAEGRTGVLGFVDRFTKMVHLIPVSDTVTAAETAAHFIDCVFRHHGLPESIVSDRDPRFTSAFWSSLFQLLGTKLSMSTAAHPETDGQTERVNRVLEDVLRSYAMSFASWSSFLPLAEFSLNNAEHASTGLTPFFANNARHPRTPALIAVVHPTAPRGSTLGGDEDDVHDMTSAAHEDVTLNAVTRSKTKKALATPDIAASPLAAWTARTLIDPGNAGIPVAANYAPKIPARPVDNAAVSEFILQLQSIARFVRDALQDAVDKQKENADKRGRKNMATFETGDQVLLSTDGIRSSAVTYLGASKLAPQFIGPFRVMKVNGEAYMLDIPTSLRLHPTFYVGRLKKYHPATIPSTASSPLRHRSAERTPLTTRSPLRLKLRPSLRNLSRCRLSLRLSAHCTIRIDLQVVLGHPSVRATDANLPRRL
ncbi:hypothetical protein PF011_g3257 [Phytophthora fragariae]|uniref:Integrase catalytic domain-containing protein n=2 Tax=Phytophthora fragariae TaxID=53985 RepID=A0A6A3LYR5_9STRA|nr:hypothetical protein PF011_g3257 [Phytophthora fragariae]